MGTGCPLWVFPMDTAQERASTLRCVLLSGPIDGVAQRGVKPLFTPNCPRTDVPCAQRNSRGPQVPPAPPGRSCPSAAVTLQLAGEPQPLLQPRSALRHAEMSGVQATEVTSLRNRGEEKNTDIQEHEMPGIAL